MKYSGAHAACASGLVGEKSPPIIAEGGSPWTLRVRTWPWLMRKSGEKPWMLAGALTGAAADMPREKYDGAEKAEGNGAAGGESTGAAGAAIGRPD
jgi:hypothetical protein